MPRGAPAGIRASDSAQVEVEPVGRADREHDRMPQSCWYRWQAACSGTSPVSGSPSQAAACTDVQHAVADRGVQHQLTLQAVGAAAALGQGAAGSGRHHQPR